MVVFVIFVKFKPSPVDDSEVCSKLPKLIEMATFGSLFDTFGHFSPIFPTVKASFFDNFTKNPLFSDIS